MNKHLIINVGRQIGSGGRVIATMLAKDFGCKFYDKELLDLAAKESGFSAKFFEQNDERKGFFRSVFQQRIPVLNDTNFYSNQFSQESLFKFQSDAIRKAAEEGPCVFVGRCADYILRDFPNTVNIFIMADEDYRIEQVVKRHQCDKETARKIMQNEENARANYYNYYTGKKWGNANSYDLCISTTPQGLEATERFVKAFIEERMKHLP